MSAQIPSELKPIPKSVLLEYQRKWVADQSQLKIAEKSRRTGITWAEAADFVLTASTAKADGGANCFYIGSTLEMAREFIDACSMWTEQFGAFIEKTDEEEIIEDDRKITAFNIYFTSGFKIQALSSNPRTLRGRQGYVCIDEAAFHEQLAEVLKAALALTMWGSKVRLISTHNGVENLFNQLIEESRAGKKRFSVHRITLEDACAQGLYERICLVTRQPYSKELEKDWIEGLLKDTATEEDALEEYMCVPKQGGGAYLSRSMIEAAMRDGKDSPVVRLEMPNEFSELPVEVRHAEIAQWCDEHLAPLLAALPDLRHVLGEDFARSGDMTVLAPMAITETLDYQVPFLVELRNLPFAQQEQIIEYLIRGLPRFTGAALDARGNGQQIAENMADKFGTEMIAQVMLSEKFYMENMPRFKASFEDGQLTIPRHEDVINDLRSIQRNQKGVPCIAQKKTDTKKKRHGDAAIALFLAVYATTLDGAPIEFTELPKHGDDYYGAFNKRGAF